MNEPARATIAIPEPSLGDRRRDLAHKQEVLTAILAEMQCDAALLLMPAHVAWLTGGMTVRGLIADGERPGIYLAGKQRWLVCSNIDTQRLFEEELNGLGFMLKEWQWPTGRAALLGDLVPGKKIASDRPFPNMPLLNDKLRHELKVLLPTDQQRYRILAQDVVHALEATARTIPPGITEREAAGQLAHRLYHHGIEVQGLSVSSGERTARFRRSGFGDFPLTQFATLQVTATRNGLSVTASRSVCWGELTADQKAERDAAVRVSAVQRRFGLAGHGVSTVIDTAAGLLRGTPAEHEWRLSQPGYSTGWLTADELRKSGHDEKLLNGQPVVWQARIGSQAIVDTVLIHQEYSEPITAPQAWPFQRIKMSGTELVLPDVLLRPA